MTDPVQQESAVQTTQPESPEAYPYGGAETTGNFCDFEELNNNPTEEPNDVDLPAEGEVTTLLEQAMQEGYGAQNKMDHTTMFLVEEIRRLIKACLELIKITREDTGEVYHYSRGGVPVWELISLYLNDVKAYRQRVLDGELLTQEDLIKVTHSMAVLAILCNHYGPNGQSLNPRQSNKV